MAGAGKVLARALMVAVPVALGVGAIYYAGDLRKAPAPSDVAKQPTLVRVITLAPVDLTPRVSGYGTVAPAHEWRAVARIEGEVTEVAPKLAPGVIVSQGTLLFRIDDSDLKLDLANVDAQLAASGVKDDTVKASLALAQSDLELAQAELNRQETLKAQGVVTQTVLDNSRRQELTARTKVTELQNQLVLNAAEREVLATQRAALQRSIDYAAITAPYDLRVSELNADLGQVVSRGQAMMTGEGIAAVDISAQFALGRIGPLVRMAGEGATALDLKARVKLSGAGHSVVWPAKVVRTGESIDERTQSSAIVVQVADPEAKSVAGERPPLRRNMFVEVELSAPTRKALVVPADAVQDGTALVVSADSKLEKRPVTVGFTSGDIAVVTKGLAEGDMLVITDPSIAVPGMDVKPVEDAARAAEIAAAAAGQAPGAPKPGSGAGGGGGGGAGKNKDASQGSGQ